MYLTASSTSSGCDSAAPCQRNWSQHARSSDSLLNDAKVCKAASGSGGDSHRCVVRIVLMYAKRSFLARISRILVQTVLVLPVAQPGSRSAC